MSPEELKSGPPLPMIAAITVNYGSHQLLEANLAQLTADCPDVLVVVVDNFTSADELSAITALSDRHGWRLLASPTNVGFGVGMNLGATAALEAGAEQLLLLNPDARIDAESLRRLREVVAADPMIMAAPVVETVDGRIWADGTDLYLDRGRMRATRKRAEGARAEMWLSGACLVVSRVLWERIDGFDERYFLYWEDVDLSWRAREAGATLQVVRDATSVHDEGGTQQESGSRAKSATYYYYNIRNRLLFAALHLSPADRRRWMLTAGPEAYDILLRGGRRQLIGAWAPWRAAITGTVDGLRLARSARRSSAALRKSADDGVDDGADERADEGAARPLRVLQSFPDPRATTNPYIWMLRECLDQRPDVQLETFSWRRALTGRYDVFHAHWPEILVDGATPLKKTARQLLFAVLLVRLRLNRTAIVRTLHNLELPQGISRREILLLRLFQRWTTLLIRINSMTELGDRAYETVVHGHYRDWFASFPRSTPQPGRLAYFGLIRRYKAVDTLLTAFGATAEQAPELTLFVGGKPSTPDLRSELIGLAAADDRVTTQLEFLTDAELVAAASAAELVVLPYREMHNSGGVLAALSLDRPVLVPDNEVNRMLSDEVGAGWVFRYAPPLAAEHLFEALETRRAIADQTPAPDLSARDWPRAASGHVQAYRRAIRLTRRP